MATWEDVRRIALALPETSERVTYDANPSWRVRDVLFAWERPLRRKDRADLGEAAPDGPILGVRVADEGVKHALITDEPDVYFTISHFDGYAAVLIGLDRIEVAELTEVLQDAWLLRAPKRLAKAYLEEHPPTS